MTVSATAMPAGAGNCQPSLMTGMAGPARRTAVTGFAAAGWRAGGAYASDDPDLFFPVSGGSRGLDLPLLDVIASQLTEGAKTRGDQDFSATYLTSASPGH
jgi:hypothetical protein